MISADQLRGYHRHAILYVLSGAGAMTAAEIHEAVTTHALTGGHPKECASITPAAVAGILRSLQNEQLVVPARGRFNTRHGRTEPTWIADEGVNFAAPPSAPQPEARPAPARWVGGPYEPMQDLSREQLMAILLVGDELAGATARYMAEVEEIKTRARRMLAGGGES